MDNKLIFTGPMGAGKTTAIAAISEVPPICTDVRASDDETRQRKDNTTVALDYGYITLDDGGRVHIYGTPGQERFDYMWKILTQGGIGLILLLDNTRPDPMSDMEFYLNCFRDFIERTGVVIGITRTDISPRITLEDYQQKLFERDQVAPIFEVDVRQAADVKILIQALLAILQV